MSQIRHLCTFEGTLAGGADWRIDDPHWLILQAARGFGYIRTTVSAAELSAGQVVVIPPQSQVAILASTLENLCFQCIGIRPGSLCGIISAGERLRLEKGIADQCAPCKIVPEEQELAQVLRKFWRPQREMTVHHRLGIVAGFLRFVAPDLEAVNGEEESTVAGLKERMTRLFNEVPEVELMELSPGWLAGRLDCCQRHASRLFVEVYGRSIREYVAELRLELACRLLNDSKRKIIDVAYESGHRSLAAFNLLFKRRFGMTPSEWRMKDLQSVAPRRRGQSSKRMRPETALVC